MTYFVTFRLADSIPQEKLKQWEREITEWLTQNPEPHTTEQKTEYRERFTEEFQRWLDAGMGECLLRKQEISVMVEEALRFFDGQRYVLGDYVVMPNHVHAVVRPVQGHLLKEITHSWKSFTAHKVNEMLGRKGTLWQDESFDCIVRSAAQLGKVAFYIQQNPSKAGLKHGEFRLRASRNAGQAYRLPSEGESASQKTKPVSQENSSPTSSALTLAGCPSRSVTRFRG